MTDTTPAAVERANGAYVHHSDYAALSAQLAEEIRVSNLRGNHIEFELLPQMAALSAQLEAANAQADRARDDALAEAIAACDEMRTEFLSPQYATNQPLSSHSERFACSSCATSIQALRTQPPASVETVTVQQAASEALMVEQIDVVADACRQFKLSEPHFRAALRAIAGEKP